MSPGKSVVHFQLHIKLYTDVDITCIWRSKTLYDGCSRVAN